MRRLNLALVLTDAGSGDSKVTINPKQAMIEMRPSRLRYGPKPSGGSADSAVLAECTIGGLLRLQPLGRPATDTYYRCVCMAAGGNRSFEGSH